MTATAAQVFWWIALPYLALGVFAVGHVWRWRCDQFGWTSRSTQLQERRMLKWGSPLFHYGTFAAIGGHVIGVLIPERWTKAIGIPENAYRWFSAGAGTLAAVLVIGGVIVLATRRLFVPRVRATTAPVDYVTLSLLLVVILTGIAPTIGINLLGHGYDYRTTVAPWFRGLFIGSPDVQPIAHAPFIYQLHATAAWMIWALWPFSRLVPPGATHCGTCGGPTSSTAAASPPRPPSRVPAGASGARSVPRTKPSRSSSCVLANVPDHSDVGQVVTGHEGLDHRKRLVVSVLLPLKTVTTNGNPATPADRVRRNTVCPAAALSLRGAQRHYPALAPRGRSRATSSAGPELPAM